jgi:hypothetical protein
MPLARYFFFVGAALLALMFTLDAYLPKSSAAGRTNTATDLSVIRIHSDQKWPERIVFDTSLPTITPVPAKTAEANGPVPTTVSEISAKAHVRDSFAQLQPSNRNQLEPADPRKPGPKLQPKRRSVAKSHTGPPTVLVAQQPRFGFFANNIW